jgi:hypothetical protein
MICDKNYSVCRGKNLELGPRIPNCKYHRIPDGCYECNDGYIVNNTGMLCIQLPLSLPADMRNCRIFAEAAHLTCKECLPNFQSANNNTECKDLNSKVCVMNCLPGMWRDHQNSTNQLKQRCVSDNCRTSDSRDPTKCETCFTYHDMLVYETWQGKGSYLKNTLRGQNIYNPWEIKLHLGMCLMRCSLGNYLDFNRTDKLHIPLYVDEEQ